MKFSTVTVKGFGRGKIIGFPTINMQIPEDITSEFNEGIYASRVILNKKEYIGALYYGTIPAFNHTEKVLEVFLIGVKDLKVEDNTEIEIEVLDFVRGVMSFDNIDELKSQIKKDVELIEKM